jgi:CheY-like chemotaxis protein/anti-sigma regulatory factor (Ser/Thr protein kinase)
VLDLARIEAGRVSMSAEPVDIGPVLEEVISTLEPMASRAEVSIVRTALPTDLVPVHADRTRLAQILMNYGSNAIKYGKKGGTVAFRVERHDRTVRMTVVDDGLGIADEHRARIFEPFHRAGQETGPIEGTGIGLAISKRLAELMGGTVGFDSELGKGSSFWVEVPAHVDERAERAAVAQDPSSRPPLPTESRVVVYIEDNPSNIAFMREVVGDFPHIELVTAPTAEIGLELCRARQPALVILDINLPGMNGFEAMRRLREWPETRDIPVIGLSAAAMPRDLQRGREAGFLRYLTKPVRVAELVEVFDQVLRADRP